MAKRGALLLCLCAMFMTNDAHARVGNNQLLIGTFNIRWFGSAEHDQSYQLPSTKAERMAAVRDFLAKEIMPLDVMAFQEIVDLKALKAVLPKGWTCHSYGHENPMHQHVALCASENYKLKKVSYDDDNIIDEVTSYDPDRARPAVRMDLVDNNGKRLIRFVAVHFKSAPNFALVRLKQAGYIAQDLKRDLELPIVVTGDFNSYPHEVTSLGHDDVKLIENQLNLSGAGFRHVPHNVQNTFRNIRYRGQFDHFYVSSKVTSTTIPKVFSVCNRVKDGAGYENTRHYLKFVSDHCPVTTKIRF